MKLILLILILKIEIILLMMDQKDFKRNLCVISEKYCSYNNNGTYCSYKCKNDYFTCGYKHCSKKRIICKHFLLNNDWKNETNLSICSIDSFKSLSSSSSSLSSSSFLLTLTTTKIITTNNDNKKEKEFEIKNETTTNNVSIIEFNKINYFIIFICVVFLFFFIFFFKNVNF